MARKKTVKKTARKTVKKTARKTVKKTARKAVKTATSKSVAKKKTAVRMKGLGRRRIAGSAELDMEFKGDFGARQIFQFLDVQTFKELEEFSPQEITDRVITPLVQAVERIRKQLAMANRHLSGDQKFARTFQAELSKVMKR